MKSAAYALTLLLGYSGCTSGPLSEPNQATTRHEGAAALDDTGADAAPAGRQCGGGARPAEYAGAILSFVAANAYHDYPSLKEKRNSKFEAFLWPTVTPSEVSSVVVNGPDGFTFEIRNAPLTEDLNGFIQNDRLPALWYQAILPTELRDGLYALCVTFSNGEQQEHSRVLVTDGRLLNFYLENKHALRFEPSYGTSSAHDTVLTWSTLRDLGGPDAYYNAWISSGMYESIAVTDLRGDNIFVAALLDPRAGLNASRSRVATAADPLPNGPMTWQVEIVDSNRLDGINQIIFPPGQNFVADSEGHERGN